MSATISPLAPQTVPDLPEISGVRLATAAAGIRYANRTDVRWMTLADSSGHGLRVSSVGQPICFAVWPYTLQDLEQATHDYDLPRRDTCVLNIDHLLHGVGGDNSWGALTHPQYTLPGNKPYEYSFKLEPL